MSIGEVCVNTAVKEQIKAPIEKAFPNTGEESLDQVVIDTIRASLINCTGLLIASPFRVLAVRQIASIVDGEKNNLVALIGQGGLFDGFGARATFEVISILIVNLSVYLWRSEKNDNQAVSRVVTRH